MTTYAVDATNATEPNDDRPASYLGIEMRVLKQHVVDILTLQDTANDSMQGAIDALEAINNTATGVTGLPATGSLAVLLSVYQELFGYTDAEAIIHPSVATKITALQNAITSIVNTGNSLADLVNQHTLSLNSHGTALSNINNTLNAINNTLTSHTNSINSITQTINATVSAKLPVGFVMQTTNAANPSTYLGYGTWTQVLQGRIPVGVGDGINGNGGSGFNTPSVSTNYGERSIYIAKGNLPPHTHTYSRFTGYSTQLYGGGANYDPNYEEQYVTTETGAITGNPATGQAPAPLPIYPPMTAFYFWKRTA